MDKFFGLDKVGAHNEDAVLLTTVHDEVEKNLIVGMLEEEEIPFLCKDRGSGEAVRILTGFSVFGCDIFVPKAVYEQAAELLDAYRNADAAFADDEIVTDDEEED
ncbi:MAG: DUF2007 domain-containing protein [Clostridia bacterium]|nr:DUF2007 domain-containing protein [Clostridia bacterium]